MADTFPRGRGLASAFPKTNSKSLAFAIDNCPPTFPPNVLMTPHSWDWPCHKISTTSAWKVSHSDASLILILPLNAAKASRPVSTRAILPAPSILSQTFPASFVSQRQTLKDLSTSCMPLKTSCLPTYIHDHLCL